MLWIINRALDTWCEIWSNCIAIKQVCKCVQFPALNLWQLLIVLFSEIF